MLQAGAVVFILGIFAFLATQYPYILQDEHDRLRYLYLLMTLLGLALFVPPSLHNKNIPKAISRLFAWVGIGYALLLAYSLHDDLRNSHLIAELFPRHIQTHNKKAPSYTVTGTGSLVIHASPDGGYYLDAKVNGATVHFMIDTGATEIVLTPSDAAHAGIPPGTLHYIRSFSSANGEGAGATVTLDTLSVGPIELKRMDAIVNKADMEDSLLGMSFLKRLKDFHLQGNTLTLVP